MQRNKWVNNSGRTISYLIFKIGLDPLANKVFEIIITNNDFRDDVSSFSVKILFEETNSRCVACEGSIKGRGVQKGNKFFSVYFESKIQLWSKPECQYFDEEETVESHIISTVPIFIKDLQLREAVINKDLH